MDISQVSDIKELKSMAYDQLALQQQSQINLNAINERIAQLENKPSEEVEKAKIKVDGEKGQSSS